MRLFFLPTPHTHPPTHPLPPRLPFRLFIDVRGIHRLIDCLFFRRFDRRRRHHHHHRRLIVIVSRVSIIILGQQFHSNAELVSFI